MKVTVLEVKRKLLKYDKLGDGQTFMASDGHVYIKSWLPSLAVRLKDGVCITYDTKYGKEMVQICHVVARG